MMVQIDTDSVEVVGLWREFGELMPPDKHGGWMLLEVVQDVQGSGCFAVFGRRREFFACCICKAMRSLCGYVEPPSDPWTRFEAAARRGDFDPEPTIQKEKVN